MKPEVQYGSRTVGEILLENRLFKNIYPNTELGTFQDFCRKAAEERKHDEEELQKLRDLPIEGVAERLGLLVS